MLRPRGEVPCRSMMWPSLWVSPYAFDCAVNVYIGQPVLPMARLLLGPSSHSVCIWCAVFDKDRMWPFDKPAMRRSVLTVRVQNLSIMDEGVAGCVQRLPGWHCFLQFQAITGVSWHPCGLPLGLGVDKVDGYSWWASAVVGECDCDRVALRAHSVPHSAICAHHSAA